MRLNRSPRRPRRTATSRRRVRRPLPRLKKEHVGLTLLGAAVVVSGCRKPDPAPTELTDLLLFTWRNADIDDDTNDASLADASINLETWFDAEVQSRLDEGLDYDPVEGLDNRLEEDSQRLDDLDLLSLLPQPEIVDAKNAIGVVVARESDCTLADYDALYLRDDQMTLFPDNYLAYGRHSKENFDCYPDTCDEVRWVTALEQEQSLGLLDVTYDYELANAMRAYEAIPAQFGFGAEPRAGRVSRVWMLEEAEVTPENIGRFMQNIQLELVVEQEDERTLHLYAQWTEARAGELNTEAGVFLNSYVDGLREYMLALEEHCRAN